MFWTIQCFRLDVFELKRVRSLQADIRKAYLKLSLKLHPDRNPEEVSFKRHSRCVA